LEWFGWTDRGRVRQNNEDAFLGLRFDAREVQHLGRVGESASRCMDFVFAVSDGMGGHNAGEYASRIAVEKLTRLMPRCFKQAATGMSAGFADVLTELFGQVNRALTYLGLSYEDCHGMATTLSLCWFTPEWMYFGHVGDSRIYYLPAKADRMKQLSEDDTHVGWLFRTGQINEREARTHPRRNMLQKALGGGNQFVDPQVGAVGFETGDIFLICSDGVVDGLYDHHIVEVLRSHGFGKTGANPAETLVREAIEKGSRDNATAIVIRIA
jgi:protein phosphatase